jgi:hypothetical protein
LWLRYSLSAIAPRLNSNAVTSAPTQTIPLETPNWTVTNLCGATTQNYEIIFTADMRVQIATGHFDPATQWVAVAGLIVCCAESPDAGTSDLGIGLYEQRLAGTMHGGKAFDLRALVPMFRILLLRPATARQE